MDPLRSAAESPESTAGARAPGTPRDAHARWLLELERAQLAQQSRQPPARAATAAAPPDGGLETPARARNAPPPAAAAQDRGAERLPSEQRSPGFSSKGTNQELAGDLRFNPVQNQPGGGEARVTREEISRAPAAPSRPAARPVPVTWPKVNVHAQWNGAGVEVWVRDASLGEAERQRLATRLREQLRLHRLTVNGEEIYQQEKTSWLSKP